MALLFLAIDITIQLVPANVTEGVQFVETTLSVVRGTLGRTVSATVSAMSLSAQCMAPQIITACYSV